MASILTIADLVGTLVPQLLSLVTQAIAADGSNNDQATLDALHTKALAAADALKPVGA